MSASAHRSDIVPMILAGGSGTRLWPVSRSALPKHLVGLVGDESLLQATVRRVLPASASGRLVTIAAAGQSVLVRRQLASIDRRLTQDLLLEPEARNTAAAVALGAAWVAERMGGDRILWVCPSDHLMLAPEAMLAAVATGSAAAAAGRIVTFGIEPTRPETGFGWIAVGDRLAQPGVSDVRRFVEKPALKVAEAMLASGDHLWNSGMFLMRADVLLSDLERFEPELTAAVRASLARMLVDVEAQHLAPADIYGSIKSTPIDKAVMERSDRVAVVPCDPRWSDVGSWHALWELMDKDAARNVVVGDGVVVRSEGNLLRAEHRLVGLVGVSDLAVIETADAVLIANRTDSEGVKALVGTLVERDRREARVHLRQFRSWGIVERIAEREDYKILEVTLDQGQATPRRQIDGAVTYVHVLEGSGTADLGARSEYLGPGSTLRVEPGLVFSYRADPTGALRVLETITGSPQGQSEL